jgi:iron complex outermembrane receptor protein
MNRVGGLFLLSCSALALTAGLPQAAAAAQAGAPELTTLEEVTVTARRREERLQDVPISVVAATQEALDQKNVKTVNDLIVIAPGLSIQNGSANRNDVTYSIRGQGQVLGQVSPGVVPYFGEVPNFSNSLFDLQSAQVLKGPQGTLFGKNTTGGAILFTPRKPSETFNGYVIGRLGNYSRQDLEFALGGPIWSDKVLFRVAGQSLNRDGFSHNLFNGQDADDENRQNWRAALTIRPWDGLENTTTYVYDHTDEAGAGTALSVLVPNPNTGTVYSRLQANLAASLARGPRVINTDWPLFNRFDNQGYINATTWKINDNITLKNIYSERKFRSGQSFDSDATTIPLFEVTNQPGDRSTRTRVATEEFQVQANYGPINGVLGYYWDKQTSPLKRSVDTEQVFGGLQIRAAVFGASALSSNAIFGQADWKVTDKLTLTAGVRQNKDNRLSFVQTFVLFPGQPVPTGVTAAAGPPQVGSFKATTWNLAAAYKVDPDLNIYATVRRGYKSGGFNGTAILVQDRLFQPEFVTDYEAGFKGQHSFGDLRTRYAVDAFYDDYTNIQRNITLTTVPASTITRNAAEGSIKGVDLDLNISPVRWFDVSLLYTYMDAQYDKYIDVRDGDLSASQFPNTPKHQLTVTPRLTLPVPDQAGKVTLLANIYHQTQIATDPANTPNGTATVALSSLAAFAPAYTRVDLRADWSRIYGSKVSAAAYVRNVFDREYVTGTGNALVSFGLATYLYGQPRMYGLELRYAFGG